MCYEDRDDIVTAASVVLGFGVVVVLALVAVLAWVIG